MRQAAKRPPRRSKRGLYVGVDVGGTKVLAGVVSGSGAVIHTVNPRLSDEQIVYILNHAEDRFHRAASLDHYSWSSPPSPPRAVWASIACSRSQPTGTLKSVSTSELHGSSEAGFGGPSHDT